MQPVADLMQPGRPASLGEEDVLQPPQIFPRHPEDSVQLGGVLLQHSLDSVQREEFELLEKFIDMKIQRLLAATRVAMNDNIEGPEIMALMVPIETELENIRIKLTH